MNYPVVEFIEHRSSTYMVPIFDAYKFKPKGRAQWLQKAAWRFLSWRGVLEQAHEPSVKVTRHCIDSKTFIDRLFKQRRNLFDHFRKEGQRLLIGSEDFQELMCSKEMMTHHFNFQSEIGLNGRIIGLNVEVIPWMRGAVVMP